MTPPGLGDEHHAMKLLAENTGGEAFYETDQLKEALERVETVSEHYYTLAYQPTSTKLDGRFHKIVVRSDRDYKLNYRRGYYADNPFAALATAIDELDPTLVAGPGAGHSSGHADSLHRARHATRLAAHAWQHSLHSGLRRQRARRTARRAR
jgi:hypothetical protein